MSQITENEVAGMAGNGGTGKMRDFRTGETGLNFDGIYQTAEPGTENNNDLGLPIDFPFQEVDSIFDLFFILQHVCHFSSFKSGKRVFY
jgi:hypothetical protein